MREKGVLTTRVERIASPPRRTSRSGRPRHEDGLTMSPLVLCTMANNSWCSARASYAPELRPSSCRPRRNRSPIHQWSLCSWDAERANIGRTKARAAIRSVPMEGAESHSKRGSDHKGHLTLGFARRALTGGYPGPGAPALFERGDRSQVASRDRGFQGLG